MLRVFLIVAVAAGLAAAVVGYTRVGGKIAELNTELTTTKGQRDQLQASEVKLKRDLRTANESLVSTTAELADTKSDLEITQTRAAQQEVRANQWNRNGPPSCASATRRRPNWRSGGRSTGHRMRSGR